MPGKQRYIRSIDLPVAGAFDAGADPSGTAAVAPPSLPAIGEPRSLNLTTAIERNAVTPTASISATWQPPYGVAPSSYVVQWSQSSTFPDPGTNGQGANAEATTISGLIPATLYYVRVAAFVGNQTSAWSATASITTAADITPPATLTSGTAFFLGGGDLIVTWVNSVSANFREAEIKIYSDAGHTTLYATLYDATQRVVWPVAANLAVTSGAGDPTLWVELRARSWGGIFQAGVISAGATKAAPSAPTISLTGGVAILSCGVTSAPESPTSMFEFVWKRDGTTVRTDLVVDTFATYAAGAAGDEGSHSWTCTVRQRDAFGQYSTATVSSAVVLDTLTIAYLRAGLIITDSVGNTVAALAVLKDGDMDAPGISYAA